ncbi:hypothetical protein [Brevundimonas sp.]|uniref:hypothetical protein n=1 Tax=Brevundimonas sp. TaxID=1871086 RepID=UPI003D6D5B87
MAAFPDHGFATAQPRRAADVYDPMRLSVIHIVASLAAAVCVVIAFIAAGAGLISGLFMLMAFGALGFIAWTALRHALGDDGERASAARNPVQPKR